MAQAKLRNYIDSPSFPTSTITFQLKYPRSFGAHPQTFFSFNSMLATCLFYNKPLIELCIDPKIARMIHDLLLEEAEVQQIPPIASKKGNVHYTRTIEILALSKIRFALMILDDPLGQAALFAEEINELIKTAKKLNFSDEDLITISWAHPTKPA